MKQLIIILALAGLWSCTGTDKPNNAEVAQALKDTAHFTTIQWLDSIDQNLGTIEQGQALKITYKFRNSGIHPLIVGSVMGSCGCTKAEGPTTPIAPGKEGEITAVFNSANMRGSNHKEVYVVSNNANKNEDTRDVLKFTVEVTPKKN